VDALRSACRARRAEPAGITLRQWHGPDGKLVEYTIKYRKLIPKSVSADLAGFERNL
jgi:hypothetical protein